MDLQQEEEKPVPIKQGLAETKRLELLSKLHACRIYLHPAPAKPPIIFKLQGQQISTPGNLCAISAQAKAGKSSVLSAMLAALLSADTGVTAPDTLSFEGLTSKGKAVLVFDTEQSEYDAWRPISRASLRLEKPLEQLPENYRIYRTRDFTMAERKTLLEAELTQAEKECGGIHALFIDGIADFCKSINDEGEAFTLVEDLMGLSVKYNCAIVLVVHENPGTNTKMRGHLGSQIERKAETTLRVERKEDIHQLWAHASRSSDIPKHKGVTFVFSEEKQMHVIATEAAIQATLQAARSASPSTPTTKRTVQDERERIRLLDWLGEISYKDLTKQIQEVFQVSDTTAEKYVSTWVKMKLVGKKKAGGYVKKIEAVADAPEAEDLF
jgi:hypothetical protein